MQHYEQNTFATYLSKLLSPIKAQALIEQFAIGTAKHWPGATIFWQIDLLGEVRTGKIMRYGEDGRRVRKPFNHIQWVHRQLPAPQFHLQQCLFGLHQLRVAPLTKTIALVESEKTAVIATAHFPDLLWLATGSVHQLRPERCEDLKGRNVILFPDVGAWKTWQEKAGALRNVTERPVLASYWLERQASAIGRKQGQDLADYLVQC
ncbi:MAG: DUF6371 domain-containing protein [Bacteroidota bacterium]